MSDRTNVSRREALQRIAAAVVAAGWAVPIERAAGQEVHSHAAAMKGALEDYERQALTEHEWETVAHLAALIVPADDVSGSAVDAGAVEFVDLLCDSNEQLAHIIHGGLAWVDAEMRDREGSTFAEAGSDAQTGLLDELVAEERARSERVQGSGGGDYARFRDYQAWEQGDLGPGVEFFQWIRKMTVDAFYTSPIGVKDLDYPGGKAYTEYVVPEEAITYAIGRSPLA